MTTYRETALDILARLGRPARYFIYGRRCRPGGAGSIGRDQCPPPHRQPTAISSARLSGTITDGSVPPIAFMAHMDHPGFEAVAVDGDFLVGAAMGGVPQSSFDAGVPLQVILPGGERLAAVTAGPYGEPLERKALISLEDAWAPGRDSPTVVRGVRPGGLPTG